MQSNQLNNKICQCCGMPLDENNISKENGDYCQWCFVNGKVVYDNMDDLINKCIPFMVQQGFSEQQAREYMGSLLPNLAYWKNK